MENMDSPCRDSKKALNRGRERLSFTVTFLSPGEVKNVKVLVFNDGYSILTIQHADEDVGLEVNKGNASLPGCFRVDDAQSYC